MTAITIGITLGAHSGGFNLLSLPLVHWHRADYGVTLVDSKVSAWADKSGNGNTATQGSEALRPGFAASWRAGKPALTGGSVRLELAAFTQGTIAQPLTQYVVYRYAASAAAQFALASNNAGNRCDLYLDESGRPHGYAGTALAQPAGISDGTYAIHRNTYAGGSSVVEVTPHGGAVATITGGAGAQSMLGLTLFDWKGTGLPFQGEIAEAFTVAGAVDVATDAQVQAYLRARYAITPA